jgi:hypothetical protein
VLNDFDSNIKLTKEKGNVNYFSIGQYWKNHGFLPLSDQSEKVLQGTFG